MDIIYRRKGIFLACFLLLVSLLIGLLLFYYRNTIAGTVISRIGSIKLANLPEFHTGSWAKVSLLGKKVSLDFQITELDQDNLAQFAQNLGTDAQWIKGISFSLDEATVAWLANYLPEETDLRIQPKQIAFGKTFGGDFFDPGLTDGSTVSGRITVNNLPDGGRLIDINDPDQALTRAVNLGQIKLSENLTKQGFWQLLGKVDRIKIEVHGQKLSGEILLR